MENYYQFQNTSSGILFGTSEKTATATRETPTGPEQVSMSEMGTRRLQYVTTPTGVMVPYEEAESVKSMYDSRLATTTPPICMTISGSTVPTHSIPNLNYQCPYVIPREQQVCNVTYTYLQPTSLALPINKLPLPPEPMVISDSQDTFPNLMACPHCHYTSIAKLHDDSSTSTYDLIPRTNPQELESTRFQDDYPTTFVVRSIPTSQEINYTAFRPLANQYNTPGPCNMSNKDLSESKASVVEILNCLVDKVVMAKETQKEELQESKKDDSSCNNTSPQKSTNSSIETPAMRVHFANCVDDCAVKRKMQDPELTKLANYILSHTMGPIDDNQSKIFSQNNLCSNTSGYNAEQNTTSPHFTATNQSITFHQLNEYMNMCFLDLTEFENVFMNQVAEVNRRDRDLVASRDNLILLSEIVNADNSIMNQMDAQLGLVTQSEYELESYINSLSNDVQAMYSMCDEKRAHIYGMAECTYSQMKQMANNFTVLFEMIKGYTTHMNKDIVGELANILNCHTNTLYCIESKMSMMKTELDAISQLCKYIKNEEQNILNRIRNRGH